MVEKGRGVKTTVSKKPIYELTDDDKAKFCEYQTEATRQDVEEIQEWKAKSLERVGFLMIK
ncbi:MAG: hypothetical protein ABR911_07685 [Syntrophales bacterium]